LEDKSVRTDDRQMIITSSIENVKMNLALSKRETQAFENQRQHTNPRNLLF
jgi:hypothetical protein